MSIVSFLTIEPSNLHWIFYVVLFFSMLNKKKTSCSWWITKLSESTHKDSDWLPWHFIEDIQHKPNCRSKVMSKRKLIWKTKWRQSIFKRYNSIGNSVLLATVWGTFLLLSEVGHTQLNLVVKTLIYTLQNLLWLKLSSLGNGLRSSYAFYFKGVYFLLPTLPLIIVLKRESKKSEF